MDKDVTEFDYKCIEFGNKWLNTFIDDENRFVESIGRSDPLLYCMVSVYQALVNFGELPQWHRDMMKDDFVQDAAERVMQYWPNSPEHRLEKLVKCILVVATLAEIRMSKNGNTDNDPGEDNS